MYKVIKNSWTLFIGIGILMVAHGLQGNLMGVRSVIEEFNFIATGRSDVRILRGIFFGFQYGSKNRFESRSY